MEQNSGMDLLPENIVNLAAATIDSVHWPVADNNDITINVLRLDKIHPVISGNKWFKLKYYLQDALQKKVPAILTFGGAYSNHIVAAACVAQKAGLASIGVIRGEEVAQLSHTLKAAAGFGMQLAYVSRAEYNQKKNPAFITGLKQQYGPVYIVPEGGEGELGVKGASEIARLFTAETYTHVLCAVGTGTLLSGLVKGMPPGPKLIGIPVLKGFDEWQPAGLTENEKKKMQLLTGYHLGGYAKKSETLIAFMNNWYEATEIPTDFVYTGKLFYAVNDLIHQGFFPQKSKLLVIHSGGLQGNDSLPLKTFNF